MVSLHKVDGSIRLEVQDRGHGFDVESARQKGFGLIGMIERVRLAGGTVRIDSSPGCGTHVVAELPLAREQDDTPAGAQPVLA
jgi:signal transduction histidine kinase